MLELVLVLLASCSQAAVLSDPTPASSSLALLSVHGIVRHGDRTPISHFPTDPHQAAGLPLTLHSAADCRLVVTSYKTSTVDCGISLVGSD